ncbi:MAG: DNA-3-methyladenine glycosylase [Candidatus Dormibacteria bacterium]
MTFEATPRGPFNLAIQNQYFGGWPIVDGAVTLTFPVEGWRTSAAVMLRQDGDRVTGEVRGASGRDAEKAWHQAQAAVSLDLDGTGFLDVGRRDPAIGELQRQYQDLRPSLFHSPYEAAAGFTIGHRIQVNQARRIRGRMAESHGDEIDLGATTVRAFPRPQELLELRDFTGLSTVKIERLQAVARAALEGWLDRDALRALCREDALDQLQTLPGVGPFFAQGILMRGAGMADAFTDDDLTIRAIKALTRMPDSAGLPEVIERTEAWRPYRMWCIVLVHVWFRSQPDVGIRGGARGAAKKAGQARPRG